MTQITKLIFEHRLAGLARSLHCAALLQTGDTVLFVHYIHITNDSSVRRSSVEVLRFQILQHGNAVTIRLPPCCCVASNCFTSPPQLLLYVLYKSGKQLTGTALRQECQLANLPPRNLCTFALNLRCVARLPVAPTPHSLHCVLNTACTTAER